MCEAVQGKTRSANVLRELELLSLGPASVGACRKSRMRFLFTALARRIFRAHPSAVGQSRSRESPDGIRSESVCRRRSRPRLSAVGIGWWAWHEATTGPSGFVNVSSRCKLACEMLAAVMWGSV